MGRIVGSLGQASSGVTRGETVIQEPVAPQAPMEAGGFLPVLVFTGIGLSIFSALHRIYRDSQHASARSRSRRRRR